MGRILRFWKVALTDALGVMCLLVALAFGWLPGPGGIPLFLIGLSLLSIHHDWAKRYIDLVQEYAQKIGELIFIKDIRVQRFYDTVVVLLATSAVYVLTLRNALWQYSLAAFFGFLATTIFLGNRQRWRRIKSYLKHKR